jgi:hypothetical protein
MSDLKNYNVVVNGLATTVQYNDRDAKRLGLAGKDVKSRKAAIDLDAAQRAAADKAAAEQAAADKAAADKKAAPAPANKAATATANK